MARTNHDCEPKAATRIGCYLRIRTVVPLLLALCGFTVNAQEERRVDITLHDLGGIQSWLTAAAINDRGVIAGWASGPAFVLDTRTGAMVTLPYFEPRSINNRGEVVGIYDAPRSSGGAQGTFWSAREGLRRLPDFVSSGINKQGDMAGNCMAGIDVYGPPCVFIAGRNGGDGALHPIDVGAGVSFARASDINDRGEVVGTIEYETGASRAFIWSARKGLRLLEPSSSPQNSAALAINNHGIVAGYVSDQERTFATEWTRSGAIIAQLGSYSALDINDRGIAIVSGFNEATGRFESKVWIPDIGVFALPLSANWAGDPWAYEINNRGQIVGTMLPLDGSSDTHVVIWDVRIRARHAGRN